MRRSECAARWGDHALSHGSSIVERAGGDKCVYPVMIMLIIVRGCGKHLEGALDTCQTCMAWKVSTPRCGDDDNQ